MMCQYPWPHHFEGGSGVIKSIEIASARIQLLLAPTAQQFRPAHLQQRRLDLQHDLLDTTLHTETLAHDLLDSAPPGDDDCCLAIECGAKPLSPPPTAASPYFGPIYDFSTSPILYKPS
ncbi:hypothetical protein CFE70_003049 [Pyrenophora teres f. teres 0-1]